MAIPWDPLYICVCHKVRPSPRAIVTNVCHRLSPAKLANTLIENRHGKCRSLRLNAAIRYSILCRSLRITQKIPPIPRATPEIHFTPSTLKIVMNFYILKEIVFQQKKFVRYVSFRNCERGEILCDISQSVYTRRRIITFCFILDDLSYSRTFQNGRNHANRFEDERGEEVRKQ